jgi:hypothetical protein
VTRRGSKEELIFSGLYSGDIIVGGEHCLLTRFYASRSLTGGSLILGDIGFKIFERIRALLKFAFAGGHQEIRHGIA